jgi:hypothetical protein
MNALRWLTAAVVLLASRLAIAALSFTVKALPD